MHILRAMAAYEEKVPVDKEAEERNRSLTKEYTSKLIVDEDVLPDPFSLKVGWLAELNGTGLYKWPSVYFMDIEKFLTNMNSSGELLHRLECEYKEGKAYRYFKCDWVKEIYYNEINVTSKYCFLKSRVTPSQSINNTPYHVWVAVKKDGNKPGGKIVSAYCTCTAGLLGCCNHVVALLFRVEAAVRSGATKPSSTSLLAKWNVPTEIKTKLVHKPIAEMNFHRFRYKGDNTAENKIQSTNENFKVFNPSTPQKNEQLKDENNMRNLLYQNFRDVASTSCFIELMEGMKKTSLKPREMSSSIQLPDSIANLSKLFKLDISKSAEDNIDDFTRSLKLSKNDILNIEKVTRKQSLNKEWFKQREGRLTASKFSRIAKRMKTIKEKGGDDVSALLSEILNKAKIDTFATRHGISMEPHAKIAVVKFLKSQNHKRLKSWDSGTVVDGDYSFLSVSPDLVVECQCCGKGLVEIKCPYTIRDDIPSAENLQQLHTINNICISRRHINTTFKFRGS